jgi:predicted  nucleic acid-binding Zn-ribbon protein
MLWRGRLALHGAKRSRRCGVDKIRSDIRDTEAKIKVTYGNLIRKREVEAEIAKYSVETTSLGNQIETLRKALKGLSEADQEIIKQKTQYDNEEAIIDSLKNELGQAEELVESLVRDFNADTAAADDVPEILNTALIKSIRAKYTSTFREIKVGIGWCDHGRHIAK